MRRIIAIHYKGKRYSMHPICVLARRIGLIAHRIETAFWRLLLRFVQWRLKRDMSEDKECA